MAGKSRFAGNAFPGNGSTNRGAMGHPRAQKIERERSERQFTNKAMMTHRANVPMASPMRGGIRF